MFHSSATLLPDSRVDVFSLHADTHQTTRSLLQDWRFARVTLRCDQGDITTAIKRYGTEPSPDVIVIETTVIDQGFTQHLEQLANVCGPDTSAIFIGPQNDITLYRHLIDMGATDYLVRPIQAQDLITVIAKALHHKNGGTESRLITVLGSKGGVGTSRITQALAHSIANTNEKISIFDCAGSWGIIGNSYGLDPLISLRDLMTFVRNQESQLEELQHKISDHLSWLATGGDPMLVSTLSPEGFESIIDALTRRRPNVIVDLSQSATGIRGLAFAKSHHIVLVTTATPLALRNTRLLIKEIHGLRGPDAPIHLVVNQLGILPKEELSLKDIHTALKLEPLVQITYMPDIFARLDTLEGKAFIDQLASILPHIDILTRKITGKIANTNQPEKLSFIQRLLQRR
jgi:pilus assembly protein CpaE